MKDSKFYRKDETLTAYAFHCGYIQDYIAADGRRVHLYKDGCYHVKILQYDCLEAFKTVWLRTNNLKDARKLFNLCKFKVKAENKLNLFIQSIGADI